MSNNSTAHSDAAPTMTAALLSAVDQTRLELMGEFLADTDQRVAEVLGLLASAHGQNGKNGALAVMREMHSIAGQLCLMEFAVVGALVKRAETLAQACAGGGGDQFTVNAPLLREAMEAVAAWVEATSTDGDAADPDATIGRQLDEAISTFSAETAPSTQRGQE